MKYSAGDRLIDHASIWPSKEILTIQGIIGEAYVVISNHGGGRASVQCEFEMQDCQLLTEETTDNMDLFKGDENELESP